jgi:hypothetical protein
MDAMIAGLMEMMGYIIIAAMLLYALQFVIGLIGVFIRFLISALMVLLVVVPVVFVLMNL